MFQIAYKVKPFTLILNYVEFRMKINHLKLYHASGLPNLLTYSAFFLIETSEQHQYI
jgi:hypothetical protein